jgi:hypothetical protein
VISDDENTSSQACRRKNARQRCSPRTPMHIEHEYFRCGAWTYVAAPDVHRTKGFSFTAKPRTASLSPARRAGDDMTAV